VLADPLVHGDPGGHTGVDRARRAELGDGAHESRRPTRRGRQTRPLLAEEQDAALGERRRLERNGSREDVDPDHRQPGLRSPCGEIVDRLVVADVLVAVGHHGATPVPSPSTDDVHLGGQERIGVAHNRPDVEIVLPVLDGDVKRMSAAVEVGDDRPPRPVSIAVDDVAPIAGGQELGIEPRVVRPRPRVRTHPDVAFLIGHDESVSVWPSSITRPAVGVVRTCSQSGSEYPRPMHVIIVGGGTDGSYLAERLIAEGEDVAIIELNPARAAELRNRLDALVVTGNGANPSEQRRAGAERAELLLAVSNDDGVNVLAAQTAKTLGIRRTVARLENPEIESVVASVGVEEVVDPRQVVARQMVRLIDRPGLSDWSQFGSGKLTVIGGIVGPSSALVGQRLEDVRASFHGWDCVISSIVRDDLTLVGAGDTVVEVYDKVLIAVPTADEDRAGELLGLSPEKIRRVIVVGGGRVAEVTAQLLREDGKQVILMHDHEDRAREIAERQPRLEVMFADATNPAALTSIGVGRRDAVAALTRDDASNILVCLIAKAMGASATVARYNRLALFDLISTPDIDAGVSTEVAAANEVLRYVRRGAYVSAVNFMTGDVEAVEIQLREAAPVIGKTIAELDRPGGMVIGGVLRGDEAIVPRGDTRFEFGDRVVVFQMPAVAAAVEKLFAV
jgi:trk/ktr system potassium uptake protein